MKKINYLIISPLMTWLFIAILINSQSSIIAMPAKTHPLHDIETKTKFSTSTVAPLHISEQQPDPVQDQDDEWFIINDYGLMRITVYGPSRDGTHGFPATNFVSRWIGIDRSETGLTIRVALEWASELGLDGICAASPSGTNDLYQRHRETPPPIIEVEGHGRYLVVDRTATFIYNTIDIWVADPWPGGTYFCERREVKEIMTDGN